MEAWDEIWVTFEWENKTYTALLEKIPGAGGHIWYLTKRGFHLGQLAYHKSGWRFSIQKLGYDTRLTQEFGKAVENTGWQP